MWLLSIVGTGTRQVVAPKLFQNLRLNLLVILASLIPADIRLLSMPSRKWIHFARQWVWTGLAIMTWSAELIGYLRLEAYCSGSTTQGGILTKLLYRCNYQERSLLYAIAQTISAQKLPDEYQLLVDTLSASPYIFPFCGIEKGSCKWSLPGRSPPISCCTW